MPDSSPATRPTLLPCAPSHKPQPIMMSTIELGSSSGLRSISAFSGIAARSSARTDLSEPLPARPIGVRMASTITASGMLRLSPWSLANVADAGADRSVYAVVAPQRDQVAVQRLAQRHDLRLEAAAQLEHELLVRRAGSLEHDLPPSGAKRVAAQLLGRQGVQRAPQRTRRGGAIASGTRRLRQALQKERADGLALRGLDRLHRHGVIHLEEPQDPANGRLVVGAQIVVDQNQHLLRGKNVVEPA